jgi:hypothetical protein
VEIVGSEEKELVDFIISKIKAQADAESIASELQMVTTTNAGFGRGDGSLCHEAVACSNLRD